MRSLVSFVKFGPAGGNSLSSSGDDSACALPLLTFDLPSAAFGLDADAAESRCASFWGFFRTYTRVY